ncbi:hypothetical protein GJU39_04625 [Pedobacter petrophilus]|uniref:Uncharacterized protein n=1 Tax=Pedobacter petrophilus TaxID=1908241 RepID=A0A7K0FUS5_9SPHI|nr:hypothetical protein [Pedobacter petrophilus]MRX75367.1 hypothetical protein [Pedobacter petrophilus]
MINLTETSRFFFLILLLSVQSVFSQNKIKNTVGVYIHTLSMKGRNNDTVREYAKDSLFVYGSKVLEEINKTSEASTGNIIQSSQVFSGYQLLDLKTDKYAQLEKLDSKASLKFNPIKLKKLGLDIHYQYYENEAFQESSDNSDGLKLKKIVYTKKNGAQDIRFTVLFRPSLVHNEPSLMPNLESKFGGRVYKITAEDPKTGERIIRQLIFKPLNQNPAIIFLKSFGK